ncbi:hypothetical protein CPB86DRAFT_705462 [Serendipita vermifera]|nr:hypothetical protein CPB86DRAFT_705462 [Serendipita vermifera]
MTEPQNDTSPREEGRQDTRQCRICLAGAEEEPELGRLIKPWVMYPTTVALFFIIVFAASFVVSFFLPELDDPLLMVPPPQPDVGITWWHSPIGIASDVIRETVHTFAEVSTPKEVLEAQQLQRLQDIEDTTLFGRFKQRVPLFRREKKRKRPIVKRVDPRAPYSPSEDGPRVTFWARLLRKFMLGLSLVGILSFLNLLITMSLFGPLQIARARWIRGGRRDGGGVRDIGTIIIIIFVAIGIVRALYGIYTMTKMLAQFLLLRAENAILEVHDDDDDAPEERREDTTKDKAEEHTSNRHSPRPENGQDGDNQPESSRTSKKPISLNLTEARLRRNEDEFGHELPDTPGGWKEEWHFI